MTTGMRYFLAVAQAQNISQAAKTLFVSQQSLSEQLKRLEEHYHTRLFIRRPNFSLTAAGEALLSTLQQIQVLEDGLEARLNEIQQVGVGTLRVGIHSTRARAFLPAVVGRYHRKFPYVELAFFHGDTAQFEQMLLAGELDLFFGIDAHPLPAFQSVALGDEPVYLVASRQLLQRYLGRADFEQLTLSHVSKLPLIVSPPSSNLQREVDAFLSGAALPPKRIITIADFETQMMMAGHDVAACFCPKQLLCQLNVINGRRGENQLAYFMIPGLSCATRHQIVFHKRAYRSTYFNAFLGELQQEYLRSIQSV